MQEEQNQLVAIRRSKAERLVTLGEGAFGGRFEVDGSLGDVRAGFEEGKRVCLAGRVTAHRDMGRSQFLDLSDITGRLQIFISRKDLNEQSTAVFEQVDIGDFLGVEGECFTTRMGEPTIRVSNFRFLSKSLRPLPEKWHGLADVEARYRQRYLDLVSNAKSRRVFLERSLIVREIRRYLEDRGFIEVETPMMQAVAGGAAAKPFQTHHNALSLDLFLRIAPELYLKRLLVGGFPKVFELNRNFRNEGISRRHNPEFTMLEIYQAYSDFEGMAALVEDLICHLAMQVRGSLTIEHKDVDDIVYKTINLERPWKRARYHDLIRGIDPDWFNYSTVRKQERCAELGVEISEAMEDFEITQQVFEKLIEEKQIDPLFVTHVPRELVPLARQNVEDPSVVDVYELIINGQEISPGYSELNDPIVQRARLLEQAGEETQKIDEEFLTALEYGMPPAGGLGLGIDRLVMMLSGAESIRDVILFPHLKRRANDATTEPNDQTSGRSLV